MQDFGVLLVDKPSGITSFDVIRKLRKITSIKKIGHTGTLDPFASGLLPICLGKATRIASLLSGSSKEYEVKMQLGLRSDSGDIDGEIIETKTAEKLSSNNLDNLKEKVLSISEQVPPRYSAVKINGKRAYQLARKNEEFQLAARPVIIHQFELLQYEHPFLNYRTLVSKGTYIRTLSETIAGFVDQIAITTKLRRTRVNDLHVSQSVKLESLNKDNWQDHLQPVNKILADFNKIIIQDTAVFKNGGYIELSSTDQTEVMVMDEQENCLGFGKIESGVLKPKMVFI